MEVDGNNFIEMWQASAQAVLRARNNQGPTFIEAHTYRQRGHVEFEYSFLSRTYRDQEEVNKWLARDKDPLLRFEQYLYDNSIIDDQKTEAFNNEIDNVVKESVSFAVDSPLPDLDSAFNNMIA